MPRRFVSKLRTERLGWGFTQKEIAPLLLIRHTTQLSRIEQGKRRPSVQSIFASCLVFGKTVDHLFPGFKERIEEDVTLQAHRLYAKVEKEKSLSAGKKRELLLSIAKRREHR